MPTKTVKDLTFEKKIFNNQIELVKKNQLISDKNDLKQSKFVRYTHYYDFSPEQRKDKELAERVKEDYIDYYHNCKVKIDQYYTAIALYKHAKIEHDKLMGRENVSNNLKEISLNNLKDYKNKIFELGIDKQLFGKCLESPDMKEPLKEALSNDIVNHYNKTAEKYGVTTTMNLETAKGIADKYNPPVYQQDYSLSRDGLNVLQALKGIDPRYYEHAPVNKNDYPYDNVIGFRYHDLVDGKFVEKPAPSGFFAKFVHYINKWFGSEYRNEKKYIESEQKALNEASEYAKEVNSLVSDEYGFAIEEPKEESEVNELQEKEAKTEELQNQLGETLENEKKAAEYENTEEKEIVKEENKEAENDIVGPGLEQVD